MIEGVLVLDETNRVQFANRAFAAMFSTVGAEGADGSGSRARP